MSNEKLNITLVKEVTKFRNAAPFKSSQVIGRGMKENSFMIKLTTEFSLN
jgi:hypothetical protein